MKTEQKKKRGNFAVLVVTENEAGEMKQFHLGADAVFIIGGVLLALFLLVIGYGVGKQVGLAKMTESNQNLETRVAALTNTKDMLQMENAELTEKVELLSTTVNDKVQKESEEAEKHMPTGFPLSGTGTILEKKDFQAMLQQAAGLSNEDAEKTVEELTKEPIVHFSAAGGTSVVASGSGTVASVADDTAYGKVLTIDHGNGYCTIYRMAAEPKVKEGDELTKGTMLFEVGEAGGILGYQIQKDGEYVDPLTLMEISG